TAVRLNYSDQIGHLFAADLASFVNDDQRAFRQFHPQNKTRDRRRGRKPGFFQIDDLLCARFGPPFNIKSER
ncbi:MAG: hypothetical protein L0Z50_41830, partial [Verrucomicrobiales bacterium]|nr:hypothetical protein [Verrucomicrobiales bacterium]